MSKKEEIIKSAVALFYRKGFEKTTIEDILKKAKISNGSFFHYFKNKNKLISDSYLKIREDIILATSENINESGIYKEKMRQAFYNYVNWGANNYSKYFFLVEYKNSKHINEKTKEDVNKLNRVFQKILYEEVERDRLIRGINIPFVIEIITSILQHTIHHIKKNKLTGEKKKKFKDKAFEMCWKVVHVS